MPTAKVKDGTRLMIPLSAAISAIAAAFGIWFALLNNMEEAIELHVKHGHPDAIRPTEVAALKQDLYQANQQIQALKEEIFALKNRRR